MVPGKGSNNGMFLRYLCILFVGILASGSVIAGSFVDDIDEMMREIILEETKREDSKSQNHKRANGLSHYEYSEVLDLSILFYEAQRSGALPETKRIPWRGDSFVGDRGISKYHNLTGGWYDAGDHVKFGLPMAYSATVLGWGVIDYKDAYEVAGLMHYVRDSLKWAYDYFIRCHAATFKFYYQVGDAGADHQVWNRPEDMEMDRPAEYLDSDSTGSDVLGETAAALATCAIIFKDVDPTYSALCLDEAKALYKLAKKWLGTYPSKHYYVSTSFGDELMWAAAWLYRATEEEEYLTESEAYYVEYNGRAKAYAFSWGDKRPGAQVLLYQLTNKTQYSENAKNYLNTWLPGGGITYTPLGLAFRHTWGSLRYATSTAFLALRMADLGVRTPAYREFGVKQVHYALGDAGHSFVVGFGKDPPTRPHHRSSSCPDPGIECKNFNSFLFDGPNHHVLYGALVGGPESDDYWYDDRQDYMLNEVACDYNAGFQSAVAALKHLEITGELDELQL
ncbi:endoglucanase E-4-like [Saccoglossus kowalevskii]|uniref:Endoglucanase n=1 Tax=Saccoglossus kowalevskii TaxID=10224 RepID=A0ABM0MR64_SACKO|nr:PREDICTED: endoglucanase-like [Saccoglossus kowalevskii]